MTGVEMLAEGACGGGACGDGGECGLQSSMLNGVLRQPPGGGVGLCCCSRRRRFAFEVQVIELFPEVRVRAVERSVCGERVFWARGNDVCTVQEGDPESRAQAAAALPELAVLSFRASYQVHTHNPDWRKITH